MKRSPRWLRIEELMRPGRLTRDGMLGTDRRPIEEIIESDRATVNEIGLTHAEIARTLRALSEAARQRLGAPMRFGEYEVRIEGARGMMPCPFGHPGRFPKEVTFLTHVPTGRQMKWSALGVHMIEAHGFYQGRGSAFRIEPEEAAAVAERVKPKMRNDRNEGWTPGLS